MLTYQNFVEEVIQLITVAEAFSDKQRAQESPDFRKWKHEIIDLISRIEDVGYSINCSIRSRIFGVLSFGSVTSREKLEAFNRDLGDTLNELKTLVERYEKYGDPKNSSSTEKIADLGSKQVEKLTAAWLWNNAPLGFWVRLLSVFFAVLVVGITIGQSDFYKENAHKFSSAK